VRCDAVPFYDTRCSEVCERLTRIFHRFSPDALWGALVWQITALASAQTCSQGIS